MKRKARLWLLSALAGLALSAVSVMGVGADPPGGCGTQPSTPPPGHGDFMNCNEPADGCSNPSMQGPWEAHCCKDLGANCYWVQYRNICCGSTWKFGYQSDTSVADSCDRVAYACYGGV